MNIMLNLPFTRRFSLVIVLAVAILIIVVAHSQLTYATDSDGDGGSRSEFSYGNCVTGSACMPSSFIGMGSTSPPYCGETDASSLSGYGLGSGPIMSTVVGEICNNPGTLCGQSIRRYWRKRVMRFES